MTEISCLRNGKAYELKLVYGGARRPAMTCSVTSKLKGLGGCSSHHFQLAEYIVVAALHAAQLVISGTGTVLPVQGCRPI